MSPQLHPFYFFQEGSKFHARPIQPDDKSLLAKGFSQLSASSRYFRFFDIQRKLSDAQLKYFTEVDGVNHVAWIILDETDDEPVAVGVGRFIRLKDDPGTAEVAFTVVDNYQRKGLGGVLFAVMNIAAAGVGIKILRYYVLASNRFVLDSLNYLGVLKRTFEDQIIIADIAVHPDHQSIPDIPELQSLIAAMSKVEGLIFESSSAKHKS